MKQWNITAASFLLCLPTLCAASPAQLPSRGSNYALWPRQLTATGATFIGTFGRHRTKRVEPETNTAQPAKIVNSGSTNIPGYQIEIWNSGKATFETFAHPWQHLPPAVGGNTAGPTTVHVSAADAKRFFADLATAGDLSKYPPAHCMKSASFGYRLTVSYKGTASPDLSCPLNDPKLKTIAADVGIITDAARAAAQGSPGTGN